MSDETKSSVGVVIPDFTSREGQAFVAANRNPLLLDAFSANISADGLNSALQFAEMAALGESLSALELSLGALQNGGEASKPATSSRETVEAQRMIGLSNRYLEEDLQKVLTALPENQRAEYLAGFLRHNDLLRNVAPDNLITYTRNPDENRPHPGDYVPASSVANTRDR